MTLNRPFAEFCRRCADSLKPRSTEAWEKAGRVAWGRPTIHDVGLGSEVANLKNHIAPAVSASARVAIAVGQGILALHEVHAGGGLLSLLRPFVGGDLDPWIWLDSDPQQGGGVEYEKPERPYEPLFLPGGRHVVFSRPGRVVVVDIWGCHGLSASIECKPFDAPMSDGPMVAPPIPLGPSTFGVLRHKSGRYYWEIYELGHSESLETSGGETVASAEGIDLGSFDIDPSSVMLVGNPCSVTLVDDRVIAFATPLGHWVWSRDHALNRKADSSTFLRTWPKDDTRAGLRIDLDDHMLDRDAFHSPKQGFLVDNPGRSKRFEWYYRVIRDASRELPGGTVQQYYVDFSPVWASGSRSLDEALGLDRDARPIGSTRVAGSQVKMLVNRGETLQVSSDTGAFSKSGIQLPNTLSGLRLFDPLIVAISADEGSLMRERYLEIHSLRHEHAKPLSIAFPRGLLSDPLIWGRWMFTAEFEADGSLRVMRRAILGED